MKRVDEMKGKGLYIAAGVVFVLALVCLFTGEIQAFGGGVVIAAALAAYGQWKKPGNKRTPHNRGAGGKRNDPGNSFVFACVSGQKNRIGFHSQQAVPGWPFVWGMERKSTPWRGAVGPF